MHGRGFRCIALVTADYGKLMLAVLAVLRVNVLAVLISAMWSVVLSAEGAARIQPRAKRSDALGMMHRMVRALKGRDKPAGIQCQGGGKGGQGRWCQ